MTEALNVTVRVPAAAVTVHGADTQPWAPVCGVTVTTSLESAGVALKFNVRDTDDPLTMY